MTSVVVGHEVLIAAFRYVLGRQTYMVGVVARELVRHWESIPRHLQEQVVREIEAAIHNGAAGDERIDLPEWRRVLHAHRV